MNLILMTQDLISDIGEVTSQILTTIIHRSNPDHEDYNVYVINKTLTSEHLKHFLIDKIVEYDHRFNHRLLENKNLIELNAVAEDLNRQFRSQKIDNDLTNLYQDLKPLSLISYLVSPYSIGIEKY